jgi:hypothetical protein
MLEQAQVEAHLSPRGADSDERAAASTGSTLNVE